jgi:toxin ParE1/3/4
VSLPVRRTNRANDDLDAIWLHIAEDNLAAAERLIRAMEAAEDQLGLYPELGQARPDLAPGLRHWPVGSYLILYRIDHDAVTIVRVLHGARDLPSAFREP